MSRGAQGYQGHFHSSDDIPFFSGNMSGSLPPSFKKHGIDAEAFGQVLDMDVDEENDTTDHEFSKGIVFDFFTQAEDTIEKMEDAIRKEDLETLSNLGHFLKGSSATLGLIKLRNNCESIQLYGSRKEDARGPDGKPLPADNECLRLIKEFVAEIRTQLAIVEIELRKFYDELLDGE